MSAVHRPAAGSRKWLILVPWCLLLGIVSTLGIAWASAAWLPIDKTGGLVAKDGDHLRPWQLLMRRSSAERFIWFEKGRIYGTQQSGRPSEGSFAAVACWSFAMMTRDNAAVVKAEFELPERLLKETVSDPSPKIWGIAEDRRGWPWPAARCWFIGTMNQQSQSPWIVEHGVPLDHSLTQRASLATLRALPLSPMWGGVAADVLVHAAIWMAVFVGIRAAMTNAVVGRRRRGGRCLACGYDLRGISGDACPECGREQRTDLAATVPEPRRSGG